MPIYPSQHSDLPRSTIIFFSFLQGAHKNSLPHKSSFLLLLALLRGTLVKDPLGCISRPSSPSSVFFFRYFLILFECTPSPCHSQPSSSYPRARSFSTLFAFFPHSSSNHPPPFQKTVPVYIIDTLSFRFFLFSSCLLLRSVRANLYEFDLHRTKGHHPSTPALTHTLFFFTFIFSLSSHSLNLRSQSCLLHFRFYQIRRTTTDQKPTLRIHQHINPNYDSSF